MTAAEFAKLYQDKSKGVDEKPLMNWTQACADAAALGYAISSSDFYERFAKGKIVKSYCKKKLKDLADAGKIYGYQESRNTPWYYFFDAATMKAMLSK